jgi:carbamoyl-phosphate synthase large subunit
MVNSNPETVSTDFDTSNRLYFEALDEESLRDILENEGEPNGNIPSSICQFGGQTAVNLATPLSRSGMPIIGSGADVIDMAEDRKQFEGFLSGLGIPQPPGAGVVNIEEALNTAGLVGYPVLVRPSYVLGGRAMEIVHDADELTRYMGAAMQLDTDHPILIDKYLEGKEVEVDAICDGETVLVPGIMEHIERAGVHSGDSMAVYPGINLSEEVVDTLINYTIRIGLALDVRGLMNIQFVVMPDEKSGEFSVYILEVNPRSSRTVPFISKVTGVPMVKLATKVMLGISLKEQGYQPGLWEKQRLFAVKAPVFSMSKLAGVDTYLGPEMKSTGEVMGIDYTYDAALAKALQAAGLTLPEKGALLLSIADKDKPEAMPLIKKLASAGYILYATEGTASIIEAEGIPVKVITKKLGEGRPNVLDVINQGTVNAVLNTITGGRVPLRDGFFIRRAATERRIPCFTSLDTAAAAVDTLVKGSHNFSVNPLPEYRRQGNK